MHPRRTNYLGLRLGDLLHSLTPTPPSAGPSLQVVRKVRPQSIDDPQIKSETRGQWRATNQRKEAYLSHALLRTP